MWPMTFIDARWQIHFVTDRPQEGGHLACKRAIAWKAQVRLCALSQSAKDWRLPVAISLLMAYLGLVPSERSTGEQVRRGSITKAGNPRPARSAAFRGLLATSSNPAHAFHFFQLASNSALAWSSVATPLSARSPAACWERKAPRTSSDRRARLFAHTKSSNCRAGRRALRSVTRPSRAHK